MWRNQNKQHSFMTHFFCASFAGACASLVTIPLDNIRTRMNTQCDLIKHKVEPIASDRFSVQKSENLQKFSPGQLKREFSKRNSSFCVDKNAIDCVCSSDYKNNIKYKDGLNTFNIILKEEGMRGFFKGLASKAVTQSLSTAISWSAYEFMKKQFVNSSLKH